VAEKDENTASSEATPGLTSDRVPAPEPAKPGDGPEPGAAAESGAAAETAEAPAAKPGAAADSTSGNGSGAAADSGKAAASDAGSGNGAKSGAAESGKAAASGKWAKPPAAPKKTETPGQLSDRLRVKGRSPDPVLPGQAAPVVNPPAQVKVSFWLWIAAGVVVIVGQAYTLLIKDQLVTELVKQNQQGTGQKVAPDQIASGTNTLVWLLLIGAVVFAVLLGLFAWKAREGTRSARSVLTGLAIVCVLFQIVIFYNFFTLIAAFVLLIALVLMYLPSVANYFPKVGKKLP
jgi:hypothetical protein